MASRFVCGGNWGTQARVPGQSWVKPAASWAADESKGGVIGRDEIGVEKPDPVGTATRERDKGIAGAGRREKRTVEVAGQESPSPRRDSRGDKSGG